MDKNTDTKTPVPIISPKATFESLREETERAVLAALASGAYVLGPEAAAFEAEVCEYLGAKHAVGVSSGTDALLLALEDLEIGPGDEVVTTCFTFIATATVIARLGAKPVFVDIDPKTYQMDPEGLARAITPRTRAVLCVHLYGHPAPLDAYREAIASSGKAIPLIEDAAQAMGTVCNTGGKLVKAGAAGLWGCFSFYPTKNLPACGEAGIMVTSDAEHAERARQLRNQGQDAPYRHRFLGGNARLDGIQAAVLRVRLPHLEEWNERRRQNAATYRKIFETSGILSKVEGLCLPPEPEGDEVANYHQFTIRAPDRDDLRAYLGEREIQSGVYYPIPVARQPVFKDLGHRPGDFPNAEVAALEVLSLPIHQDLQPGQVEQVGAAIVEYYSR